MDNLKYTNALLNPRCYIVGDTEKRNIILHGSLSRSKYTATSLEPSEASIIDRWNLMGEKYTSHYVVTRQGAIYQCMPEGYWTSQLKLPKKMYEYDRRSIHITLVNELYLEREGKTFYAFGIKQPHNRYAGPTFEQNVRGYLYWADYDKRQILTVASLISEICSRQMIPGSIQRDTMKFTPEAWDKVGILSHANVKEGSLSLPFPNWVFDDFKAAGLSVL